MIKLHEPLIECELGLSDEYINRCSNSELVPALYVPSRDMFFAIIIGVRDVVRANI